MPIRRTKTVTDQINRTQADRSHWITPPEAPRWTATPEALGDEPLGTVLGVDVHLGEEAGGRVHLSVVKVSATSWAVHQGRAFPADRLVGARVARRVRRDDVEVTA